MQVPKKFHKSAIGKLSRRPTEPPSFCKRCMSKWGQDGREGLGHLQDAWRQKAQGARRRLRVQCNASVHAVVAVTDKRRYELLDAWSPLTEANFQIPSIERSDLATPVDGHVVPASMQLGRVLAPGSSGPTTATSRPQDRSFGLRG